MDHPKISSPREVDAQLMSRARTRLPNPAADSAVQLTFGGGLVENWPVVDQRDHLDPAVQLVWQGRPDRYESIGARLIGQVCIQRRSWSGKADQTGMKEDRQ
jgi:hypothetical protein